MKSSLSEEMVVVWVSSSGVVFVYFRRKELLQQLGIVLSYSGK